MTFILIRWRGRIQELTLGPFYEESAESTPVRDVGGDQELLQWVLAIPSGTRRMAVG